MIRIIQAGVGVRGSTWARIIQEDPGVEHAALVDPRFPELKSELGGLADRVPCFRDLATALDAAQADAVLLATPPEGHHLQASMAYERGLHVLAEKPLAEDLEEALDLVREAERRDLQLMVGMNFRYLPAHQATRRLLADGEIGAASFAQFTYVRHRDGRRADLNKYCLTQEQPVLVEQSIHHLDLMRYCYQQEVEWLQADTWNPAWSTYRDDSNVSVLLCFKDGLRVNYLGTWTAAWNRFDFRWRTDCTGGVLVQKHQFNDLYLVRFRPELGLEGTRFKEDAEPLEPVELEPVEYFVDDTRGLLREFVVALSDGRPVVTSGKDHLKTLGLTLACIEASKTGSRVYMSEFYRQHNLSW
jgi:predicted dehydrogenase